VRTCVIRNLGTDEPLTTMNGMARGRATHRYHQNRQNRRNLKPPPDRLSFRILYRSSSEAVFYEPPHDTANAHLRRGQRRQPGAPVLSTDETCPPDLPLPTAISLTAQYR